MKRSLPVDLSLVLSLATVLGMAMAVAGRWPAHEILGALLAPGLALVYLAGGFPTAWRAVSELWREHVLDIDLLMIAAAIAAAVVGAPFEGAVLLTLFSISTTLEERALGRARRAIEALMALRPETALRRTAGGAVEEVAAGELAVGDVVVLRPGARVPSDGVVLTGRGGIDEANITGESMPVSKEAGAQVFEATVNLDGVMDMTVTNTVGDSTIARMIRLVTEAQAARAPSERFSEWFGQRYTVAVMAGAVIAFAAFWWMGRDWEQALYRAATLLVAASPCAIVISVPAAILSALSAAARGGVLFKGGAALETLASVETFAFDKTGTLTTGRAAVTRVVALDGDEAGFLSLLAGLEAGSEHHIAAAIAREAGARGLAAAKVVDATARPGFGILGRDEDGPLWAGNPYLAEEMGARIDHAALQVLADTAQTVVYLGRGQRVLGAVCVADEARPSSAAALAALRRGGVRRIVMMTGDRRPVALRIGGELGLVPDEIHAGMLPEDKVRRIAELTRDGKVAFVGDGVNDAAALARADVGIAMGAAGSDVALETADVALMADDLKHLPFAVGLSRHTRGIIRQNVFVSLGIVAFLVPATIFGLGIGPAVAVHEGSTLLVVFNALRLLAYKDRS